MRTAAHSVEQLLAQYNIKLSSTAPGRYYTTCPECSAKRSRAHQNNKVLGVTIGDDGSVRWGCNHCDWTGPTKGSGNGKGDNIAATYDYRDADGTLLFQKVRKLHVKPGESRFWIRRPNGRGGWIKGIGKGVSRPLYRLPEVIEAIAAGYTIAIVEGEKDADNLWRMDVPATCNFDGAADTGREPKWKPKYSEMLRDADIVAFSDNDAAGYAHADATCRMSLGIAKRVRRLDLAPHWPDMPPGKDVSDWLAAGHTREDLDALIEEAPDYPAASTREDATDGNEKGRAEQRPAPFTAAEALKNMQFEPIKYVVPGVIVEGLTLLAAKPKFGKSWLMLHAAIAVARGGFTLGEIHCTKGDVLYCALEDNLRRLKSRMTKLLGSQQPWPKRLQFICEMPRLAEGGLTQIKEWIAAAPHPRLVIIDTLAMVRAPKKRDESSYDADYAAVRELRALANQHGIAIVAVHHLRKADADDAFDTVSGTLGLIGAPDTILVLKRDTTGTIVLHGRGRDLVEIEKAMTFNKDTCTWAIAGDVSEVRTSGERRAILDAMKEIGAPATPTEIAAIARLKPANVRRMMLRMAKDGLVRKCDYGKYEIANRDRDQTE